MPSADRRAVCAWIAAAICLVALVMGVRVVLEAAGGSGPTKATADQGAVVSPARAPPGSADLAPLVRQLQHLRGESARIRTRMGEVDAQVAVLNERVATLDEMLAEGRLTHCPAFLHDETTVRVLQGILRETAAEASGRESDRQRLNTTAMVARQRLVRKLTLLRDQMAEQAARLTREGETLRDQARLVSGQMEELQQRLVERLKTQAAEPGAKPA